MFAGSQMPMLICVRSCYPAVSISDVEFANMGLLASWARWLIGLIGLIGLLGLLAYWAYWLIGLTAAGCRLT